MSSFRFNDDYIGAGVFSPVPSPGKLRLQEGHVWNDAVQKNILNQLNGQAGSFVSSVLVNATPVTATNPSTAADLMTLALPAGYTSVAGKTLYVWGSGTYTTAGGQTPTMTLTLLIGGITPLTFVSTATTASETKTWNMEGFITTVTAGAAGTYEAHGVFAIELGGGAAGSVATTSFNDTNSVVSSTLDQTAAQTLKLQGLLSSSNASNAIAQRQMIVQVIN